MNTTKNDFAEVIESSLYTWLAQSWKWNSFPIFGSLVSVYTKERTLFGIVYSIQTGSMDPIRYPFTYQKTEEELLQEQPQIFEFLKTTFHCLCIGYKEKNHILYTLAPEPPTIHAFVGIPENQTAKQFFSDHAYLHLIFGSSTAVLHIDELLLALLMYQKRLNLLSASTIETFIEYYSLLTGNDYLRLKLFLRRAQYIVHV